MIMQANRVGGRIDLLAPTPPDMRVRVRRFLAVPKDESALSLSALLTRDIGSTIRLHRRSPISNGSCCLPSSALRGV
jgi:hypothetical protein